MENNNLSSVIWNWLKYICNIILPKNPDFMKIYFHNKITWPKLNLLQIEELLDKEMNVLDSNNESIDSFITDSIYESEYSIEENENFWKSIMNELKITKNDNKNQLNRSIINYCKSTIES